MTGRKQVIEDAALRLLTGEIDSTRLFAVRSLLAPIAADESEAAWIRDALTTALTLLERAATGGTDADSALRRVATLLDLVSNGDAPAPSPALPIDAVRELLPQFVAESIDCLDQAERALLELESNPASAEAIDVVFRAFHTIKSTSAFFGLEVISSLAHETESSLCPVRDGDSVFTHTIANQVLASADTMRSLLQALTTPATETPQQHAIDAESWVRVRTDRLDQLLDMVGELVVAHSMLAEDDAVQQERHGPLARKVQQTNKIVRELQSLSMSLRMVPLRPVFQKMRRLVRDLSQSTDKPVELVTDGEETELDRHMVEALGDPLVHMIRNAMDHGIETAAERIAAGKREVATIHLNAWHEGGSVVVELSDNGRGLDHARIVASAMSKGLIESARDLSPAEINELIFKPGFSTSTEVTELSGRGVGMDVVRKNIDAMNGRVEIASTPGHGTTFTIRVPLTRAITDGMLVRVGEERYIVPTNEIQTSFRPQPENLAKAGGDGELVMLQGKALPVVRLHHVLGVGSAETDPTRALLVVLGESENRFALLVDDLLGQQQFVAKPVTTGMSHVPGIAGGAILGDGRVGLILDPVGVFAAARRMQAFR